MARPRARQIGLTFGDLPTGRRNSLTDVEGVRVGQVTLCEGDDVRTGVTAILPHGGNLFQEKVSGAVFVANGFGKLSGLSQIEEMGTIETPILLTNTLAVGTAMQALVRYTLAQPGNEEVRSVNPVVGETNDGGLNDIRGLHVTERDCLEAISAAHSGLVEEGCVGAGTGVEALGFKSGIGTSSRVLACGGWTIGVLVQANFPGTFVFEQLLGLGERPERKDVRTLPDGSCMVVLATDAPLCPRNLKRLAARAFIGLGRAGGFAANSSGEYVISFSTSPHVRVKAHPTETLRQWQVLEDTALNPLFEAAIDATLEAVANSLTMAWDMQGRGTLVRAIPLPPRR